MCQCNCCNCYWKYDELPENLREWVDADLFLFECNCGNTLSIKRQVLIQFSLNSTWATSQNEKIAS